MHSSCCHKKEFEIKKIPEVYDVLAIGLRNPSGFAFTPESSIFITQPGLTDPTIPPSGAFTDTGRISRLSKNGHLKTIIDNYIGVQAAEGSAGTPENVGLAGVEYLDGNIYILTDFGAATGLLGPSTISGVFRLDFSTDSLVLIADIGAYDLANCPGTSPNCCLPPEPPFQPDAPSPFQMVAWQHKLYITNGHTDTIDIVDPRLPLGSNVSRFVNFSTVLSPGAPPCGGAHPVLTGITVSPDREALYVVQLTPAESQPTPPPGPPNNGIIWRVDKLGNVQQIAQGYSYGQGIAVDVDGSIYITQFATYISAGGAYTNPGSLVRYLPNTHTFETILTPLILPGQVKISGHYLYLLTNTQLGDAGQGQLIRLDLCKYRLHH